MRRILIIAAAVLATQAQAQTCFEDSALKYTVHPDLLRMIAKHESNQRLSAINRNNKNGSVDYCAMQINSVWLPKLAKFNITPEKLLTDPCLCIDTGAWIYAQCVKTYGNTWKAVGCYNVGVVEKNPNTARAYAEKVLGQRYVYSDLRP